MTNQIQNAENGHKKVRDQEHDYRSKVQLNTKLTFNSAGEIAEFMSHIPHYAQSFEGARTINYTCTASNLKPNSPALQKNPVVKRNCTATVFYGFMKNTDIWYLKRFNKHGKFCAHREENNLQFDFDSIAELASKTKKKSRRHAIAKTQKIRDPGIDFYAHWIANKNNNGVMRRIGEFLQHRPDELRYEIIYNAIYLRLINLNKSSEKQNELQILAYFGFKDINIIFLSVLPTNLENAEIPFLEEFSIFSATMDKNSDYASILFPLGIEKVCLAHINELSNILNRVYNCYVELRDEFCIVGPTLCSTFSWEYNFLNKHNRTFSNAINLHGVQGMNYIMDLSNCKRNVFEIKFYERKTRDIADVIYNTNDEQAFKYTMQVIGFNGADRRELLAFTAFEAHSPEMFYECVDSFLRWFLSYFAPATSTDGPIRDVFTNFLNVSTFIIPYELSLIDLLNRIGLPYFINTRSLTEYLMVLEEFTLKNMYKDPEAFNVHFIETRDRMSLYFDSLTNQVEEKENPQAIQNTRKAILDELVRYENQDIRKNIIYIIPNSALFVTLNMPIGSGGYSKPKNIYCLNNNPIASFDEQILEKLEELSYATSESTNSQLTFSTFYEIQWMISSKNYEISLEANRNESLQDLKMMDKPNYATNLKLSDINFALKYTNNALKVIVDTDIRFIVRALMESIKAVPFYLSRNIYSKLLIELADYENESRKLGSSETIVVEKGSFVFDNIMSNISDLVIKKKVFLFGDDESRIDIDDISHEITNFEIIFNSKSNSQEKDTKRSESRNRVSILKFHPSKEEVQTKKRSEISNIENPKGFYCSCKRYNHQLLPCFHLIMIVAVFTDSFKDGSIHSMIYDYISPVYGIVGEKCN